MPNEVLIPVKIPTSLRVDKVNVVLEIPSDL